MSKFTTFSLLAAVSIFALAACDGGTKPATEPEAITVEETTPEVVAAYMRPAADAEADARRHPKEVMAFFGVEPGQTILELEAGSGYYTELFSRAVGPDGKVIMQNPAAFDGFLGDAVPTRLADNRLPNVTYSKTNFDALEPADESVDMVTWFQGPHELYFTPEGTDGLGDVERTYAEIFRVLKPGGIFAVVDHTAAPGSSSETGSTLHRIAPEIVIRLANDAGFVVDSESDILSNPDDTHELNVFDPAIRGVTDQFVIRFVKPV